MTPPDHTYTIHVNRIADNWLATAFGFDLPDTGICAYGTSPADAMSNAAIRASNLVCIQGSIHNH